MEAPAQDNFFQSGFHPSEKQRLSIDHHHHLKQEPFVVEEFLDFSNDNDENNVIMSDDDVKLPLSSSSPAFNNNMYYNAGGGGGLNSAESSSVTVVDRCNPEVNHFRGDIIGQRSLVDVSFAGELCVAYEDRAELEWLSTITEESFSSEDMQKLQLISGMTARLDESRTEPSKSDLSFRSEMLVSGKARSRRSRTAPGNWASRLLVLSPTSSTSETEHPFPPTTGSKSVKAAVMKKKDGVENGAISDGRRCLHCATDKTPQWRTGPMGPKTLCNACGVRYKSGRLVPEYRPAASPTFVQTKHSNSHRKVLELRRRKEMHRPHHIRSQHHQHPRQFLQHQQNMFYDVSNGEDFLIHQHTELIIDS